MFGSLVRIAVGEETQVAVARNEAEGGNLMARRPAPGLVTEIEAAEADWERVAVVKLDKIVGERCLLQGQPLVDAEPRWGTSGGGDIGGAEGGNGQPPGPIRQPSDRQIRDLWAVSDGVEQGAAIGHGIEEIKGAAGLRQIETKMQPGS